MTNAPTPGWRKAGIALSADPLYRFIEITSPHVGADEVTERAIIDTPWVQRLRQIHQLQSTWWVYPAAEHTRFQHVMGVMHMAGKFAQALYPSLSEVCKGKVPSAALVEELMRMAGLLHDVGHGPFGHFFDAEYLEQYGITHEDIGQAIILKRLGPKLRALRRGPSGPFGKGESVNPRDVAYLIKRPTAGRRDRNPRWLQLLRPLFSGIYTVDNLDYVMRDAYMAGIGTTPVNVERLLYYTFYSPLGLTLHENGLTTLRHFVEARRYLYENLYYHRTGRAIDMQLQDVFADTIRVLYGKNPLDDLDGYCTLTDWSVMLEAQKWRGHKSSHRRRLGQTWAGILNRQVRWKEAGSTELSFDAIRRGTALLSRAEVEERVRRALPAPLRRTKFRVDLAAHDLRPENPLQMGDSQIFVYERGTGKVNAQQLSSLLRDVPFRVVRVRLFATSYTHRAALNAALDEALQGSQPPAIPTNV